MPPEPAGDDRSVQTLNKFDVGWAMSVGYYRFHESEKRGLRQSDGGNDPNGLANHRRGAAAELALCGFLNIAWQASINTYNNFPDLEGFLECRSKTDRQAYLRLYPRNDKSKGSAVFVSVTRLGNARFRVDGWIPGAEAMQEAYLRFNERYKRQEWQVPLHLLQPAATLRAELDRRLAIVNAGRDRMRSWVQETMKKDGLL